VKRNGNNPINANSPQPAPGGDNLNPAPRSRIKNVRVPILVEEHLEERKRKVVSQEPAHFLDSAPQL
jgi:hypothetical protein